MNLGLRVSLFGTYREKEHQAYNFEPAVWDPANAPLIDSKVCLDLTTWLRLRMESFNAALPARLRDVRLGISSIRPRASDLPTTHLAMAKLSIRAAYGVFFEHTNGNEGNSESLEVHRRWY